MDQFNKALSFILGLVVVAVFIIVASGKINIKGLSFLKAKTATNITPSVTPSVAPITTPKPTSKPFFSFLIRPTAKPTAKPAIKSTVSSKITPKAISKGNTATKQQTQQDPNYHPYPGSGSTTMNTPQSIPNTGIPVLVFPLFGASFITGIFMNKKGRRE